MLQYIAPATGLLFTLENILWINIGVFVGAVFAAIPGLSVILCVILFLPVTYTMTAIPGMMFLLGIYCAGGYGGSVSAILINTPGTPHAAATMLDGHPLSQQGRTKAALKIALYASTFGGIFSALMLLFLGPQVAKVAAQLGTAEYFMVCVFGLTIIAGVSGKSIIRGLVSACLGLLISCVGTDPMTSYDRFTFGIPRLYLGLDLAVCLIGLFALVEILAKAEKKRGDLHMDTRKIKDDGKITRQEYKRMARPVLMSSIIGVLVGIIPGTGASEASWFSYNTAKNLSKHPEEFGHGSVEGIAAAESANNAVTGATIIPLLTLGIPGDGVTAMLLGAFMIHGLTPGPLLFVDSADLVYTIFIACMLANVIMLVLELGGMRLFVRLLSIPKYILLPIVLVLCTVGAFATNNRMFDAQSIVLFGVLGYLMNKLKLPVAPFILSFILCDLLETNLRRGLMLTQNDFFAFFTHPIASAFMVAAVLFVVWTVYKQMKDRRTGKAAGDEISD